MGGNVSIRENHKRKVEMVTKDSMVKMVIKNVDKDEDVGSVVVEDVGEDSVVVEDVGEDSVVVEDVGKDSVVVEDVGKDSEMVEDVGEDSAVALPILDVAEVMIREKQKDPLRRIVCRSGWLLSTSWARASHVYQMMMCVRSLYLSCSSMIGLWLHYHAFKER